MFLSFPYFGSTVCYGTVEVDVLVSCHLAITYEKLLFKLFAHFK